MKYLILFMAILLTFFAVPCFLPSEEARDKAPEGGLHAGRNPTRPGVFVPAADVLLAADDPAPGPADCFCVARSRKLADACSRWVRGWWLPTVLLVGVVWALLEEAINLPFGLARLEHSRAWGLTERSTLDWLQQHYLAFAVYGGIEALVLAGFYVLLRYLPRTWWLACSLAAPLLGVAGADPASAVPGSAVQHL